MQADGADEVELLIYDVTGQVVHRARVVDAREYQWNVNGVGSGVYTCQATAKKAGQRDIRKTYRLGVVR